MSVDSLTATELRDKVRDRYAAAASEALNGAKAGCGSAADGCCATTDPITSNLYDATDSSSVPVGAMLGSLGCGNPAALAELHAGEVVLDLGSGGGIDVLLSARRVGASGHAYGVDMTDEMLELARRNAAEAGATNVTFLKGAIESVPLEDASVDVIISNCVVNLAADKRLVAREAFRVLRPGGRLAISDLVTDGPLPSAISNDLASWTACVGGALDVAEFREILEEAGFSDISLEPTRIFHIEHGSELFEVPAAAAPRVGTVMSAFVRATKTR